MRWQDAIFEGWSTLSFKTSRGAIADRMIGYSRPTRDRIHLWGVNESGDSIRVVLDRIDKQYPLVEGRQSGIQSF